MRRIFSFLVTAGVLCGAAAAQAQNFDAVNIQTTAIGDDLAMLTGQGGNIGLFFGPEGVLMIDDQFAPLSDKINKAVQKVAGQPVRFLVNTHWHGDHTGGNEAFGGGGALIVAHENVRTRMEKGQAMPALGRMVPPAPDAALPVVTFKDGVSFHLNGTRVDVYHTAHAHTDGDALVHFPGRNVLHMGDVYFNGFYPFIDGSSAGSLAGMIAGVARGLELADAATVIIPGHGPLSDRQELVAYHAMLTGVAEAVAAAKAKGMGVDDAVAADILAPFDAEWAGGFMTPERFLRSVYMLGE